MVKSSLVSGFYKLNPQERLKIVKEFANLSEEECNSLQNTGALSMEVADRMIENVVGAIPIPVGIGVNFLINGHDYMIPMAIEEPSVVAAASYAAKMVREGGGFHTSSTPPIMTGKIQTVDLKDANAARLRVLEAKDEILKKANDQDPMLNSVGGGAKDLDARVIQTTKGAMLITELQVDCRDAMGANAVNTNGRSRIPHNRTADWRPSVSEDNIDDLATKRLARAWCTVTAETLGGDDVVDGIVNASAFAAADPYRAATHNKGALNGIAAVVLCHRK